MNLTNYEAEASVLGSVLLEGDLFKELTVEEAHFSELRHRTIFRAMTAVADNGHGIDIVTVTTALGESIHQVGEPTYLLQLAESVASTASIRHHERLIVEAYQNRKSKELAISYARNLDSGTHDQLLHHLQSVQGMDSNPNEKTTDDFLLEIAADMYRPDWEATGFPTSYTELDEMTGGLQRGELIIVAARPSVGKTAFALNLAAGHCGNGGTASIFSLEMGTKQLLRRMISAEGRINGQKWRSMAFNEQDYAQAIQAIGVISSWKLFIHEKISSLAGIRASLQKTVDGHPGEKQLAVIDYLQLIAPSGRRERRDLEVGEITRELKLLAMELDIPIVLLSQLSRGVEQRQDKRPFMSDLRESGNIEQDADTIAFLYRDDYYNKEAGQESIMEIIIAKQRNGPTGTVELVFSKEYGRFVNLTNQQKMAVRSG